MSSERVLSTLQLAPDSFRAIASSVLELLPPEPERLDGKRVDGKRVVRSGRQPRNASAPRPPWTPSSRSHGRRPPE